MSEPLSKFILTVIVGSEQVGQVEEALIEAGESLNAGLTRGDFEPVDPTADDSLYRKVGRKRLRDQGRLA